MLELQPDWARATTYEPVNAIVKEHAGAYGLGLYYARDFIGAHAVGRAHDQDGREMLCGNT